LYYSFTASIRSHVMKIPISSTYRTRYFMMPEKYFLQQKQTMVSWKTVTAFCFEGRLMKKCMEYEVEGTRPRGRPKKTSRKIVEKDCRAHGLKTEDAMDRCRWRKQIGMIDDHDECSG